MRFVIVIISINEYEWMNDDDEYDNFYDAVT